MLSETKHPFFRLKAVTNKCNDRIPDLSNFSVEKCLIPTKYAFTLLELLLVIAIIAVLAGIITFALRPAENIQNATDVQTAAKASDIEKAIQLYALDNNGDLPGNILENISYGYHEICNEGEDDGECVVLDELVPNYLSQIPEDETRSTTELSGYILKYNPEGNSIDVMSASEYESKTEEILSDGLVGYWKMDENSWNGTAGEVVDSSGNGNNGTRAGNATIVGGKYGNAGSFDGSGDYVTVPLTPMLSDYTNGTTVSLWLKPAAVINEGVYGQNGPGYLNIIVNNSRVRWETNAAQAIWSNTNLSSGSWYHIVGVYDPLLDTNKAKLYIDGILDVQGNRTSNLIRTIPITLGAYNSGATLEGDLDEIRVYNRALNQEEIFALYSKGAPPVAHWKFNEGSGTTAFDSSDNSYDGTLVNSPAWVEGKYGSALSFDGVNDYVDMPDNLTDFSDAFTVSLWTNWNSLTGRQALLGKDQDTSNFAFVLVKNSTNQLHVNTKLAGSQTVSTSYPTIIQTDKWYFVTATVDLDSKLSIYVNSSNPTTTTLANRNNIGDFRIGNTPDSFWGQLNGIVDDVRIYNYARTPEQIIKDMNND